MDAISTFMIEGMDKSRDVVNLKFQLKCGPFDVTNVDFNDLYEVVTGFDVRNPTGLSWKTLLRSIETLTIKLVIVKRTLCLFCSPTLEATIIGLIPSHTLLESGERSYNPLFILLACIKSDDH
ncbi:hypothetical protein V6N13_130038 [Hibiscus sabdariffa]|uniref:Uncharacterized protein n=1 Tax=Hibiscus sabdariffa TaxID=183260 RepID=A0ABR2SNU6_9ROSI